MSVKLIDLRPGVASLVDSKDSLFLKNLKKIFRHLGMTYNDPCCPDECGIGGFITPKYPTGIVQNIYEEDGNQTVNLTSLLTVINTGDLNPPITVSVPNATTVGHVKRLFVVGEGSSVDIEFATPLDGTTDTVIDLHTNGGHLEVMWGCNNAWILTGYVEDPQSLQTYPS